jgi:hypothetical protein
MKEPQYATAIDSFISTSMVCAAFSTRCRRHMRLNHLLPQRRIPQPSPRHRSQVRLPRPHAHGGNAALLHSLLSSHQFFVIYWIGSSLGALSSIYTWPHVEEALAVKQA